MTVGKAVLIAGGVAVGAYVLLEVLRPAAAARTAGRPSGGTSDAAFFSGLLNFGANVINQLGSSGANSYGSTVANYNPNTAYAPGASSAGPWAPTAPTIEDYNPSTAYAPGASTPGPWAPT